MAQDSKISKGGKALIREMIFYAQATDYYAETFQLSSLTKTADEKIVSS